MDTALDNNSLFNLINLFIIRLNCDHYHDILRASLTLKCFNIFNPSILINTGSYTASEVIRLEALPYRISLLIIYTL